MILTGEVVCRSCVRNKLNQTGIVVHLRPKYREWRPDCRDSREFGDVEEFDYTECINMGWAESRLPQFRYWILCWIAYRVADPALSPVPGSPLTPPSKLGVRCRDSTASDWQNRLTEFSLVLREQCTDDLSLSSPSIPCDMVNSDIVQTFLEITDRCHTHSLST